MIRGLLSLRAVCVWHSGVRGLATAVDKATLSKLRKRTGISFINCKKALEQFENDLEKAEKWLKEQAQKEGWAKATKLQSRAMSNGLVAIVCNNQAATMIEVNCETDFVARNNKFISLTTSLAQDCHRAMLQQSDPEVLMDKSVGAVVTGDGKSLADRVALEVGNIGENMALRRAVHLKGGQSKLSAYVHASGPEIATDSDTRLGKYGVVISLDQHTTQGSSEGKEALPLDEISHALGQHIVGMNPKLVGCWESEEPGAGEDKEEQGGEEGKEEGKEEEKEEERLVFQEFLLDPSLRVGELLKVNGVRVNTFHRFACGEELPEDEKDS
ncbi:elongation factor Ts, mitochondrial-like [Babylonia areolata]|uniref:elongation factor Ts, mitochondrial-like n=1 Tax=Babylonia areolata TaxID=304850 RepID=UPI003FD59A56